MFTDTPTLMHIEYISSQNALFAKQHPPQACTACPNWTLGHEYFCDCYTWTLKVQTTRRFSHFPLVVVACVSDVDYPHCLGRVYLNAASRQMYNYKHALPFPSNILSGWLVYSIIYLHFKCLQSCLDAFESQAMLYTDDYFRRMLNSDQDKKT